MPMNWQAAAVEQGSKLLAGFIRGAIIRSISAPPKKQEPTIVPHEVPQEMKPVVVKTTPLQESAVIMPKTSSVAKLTPAQISIKGSENSVNDEDYRFECITKHLATAGVLLREAHERAITANAVTDGVSEKVMAAIAEHGGMDDDFKPMLSSSNVEVREVVDYLMDGVRQFRRAAWDSRITVSGGTVEDIKDARVWNDMLFQKAYQQAKKHVGSECVMSGM